MTRLVVNPGSCGYNVSIAVEREKGVKNRFTLTIETGCKHVNLLAKDLPSLDMMDAFTAILHNPVYKAAASRLKHPACPVPSGILKALEVEAGLNVPKDVSIIFEKRG
jgi:hypothetical protein